MVVQALAGVSAGTVAVQLEAKGEDREGKEDREREGVKETDKYRSTMNVHNSTFGKTALELRPSLERKQLT